MDSAQIQYDKMTKTPVKQLIIKLAIPTILSMLVTTIYNLVDTAFVGKLGNSQSAAVGVVFGFMSVLQAIGFMFGQGSGSLLSRKLGERDYETANKTASTGFFTCFLAGIVLAVVCLTFLDPLVVFLGSTPTIAPYAKQYIRCLLVVTPFTVSSFTLNNMLRYEGKAKLGMIGLLTGGILNIAGDAIFMFGMNMGVFGAGLSTALSQMISFSILLFMFLSGKTQSKLSLRKITYKGKILPEIIVIGFPSMLRQGLSSVATILLNLQAAKFAFDEGVAAMSIVNRVAFGIFAVALGIGQGFQPVCAFNTGAHKYKRLREAYKFTLILSCSVLAVLTVFMLAFSSDVVGVFRDDPTVIEIGTRALIVLGIAQMFLPICLVSEMLMQSSGQKVQAIILSSLRGGIIYIPALIILPYFRGMYGVEEAQPLAYVLSVFPALILAKKYFDSIPDEDEEDRMVTQ